MSTDNPFEKMTFIAAPDLRQRNDPAPDPMQVHEAIYHETIKAYVEAIGLEAITNWSKLRDHTDELIRALQHEQDHIIELIDKLLFDAQSTASTIETFGPHVAKLRQQFRMTMPNATDVDDSDFGRRANYVKNNGAG